MVFCYRLRRLLSLVLKDGTDISISGAGSRTATEVCEEFYDTLVRTAKLHVAWSGVILSVFYAVLILLGGATTVALDGAGLTADPVDMAFPLLITEYLPTTIGSVIIIAVMSAILSTTDQSLHAAGITTANDIYDYFVEDASQEKLFKVSRIATIVAGVTAILVTVDPPGTIIFIYEFRAVLLTAALFVPVYAGLWKRKWFSGVAIAWSMVLGGVISVGWQFLEDPIGVPAVFAGVGFAVGALVVVSLYERAVGRGGSPPAEPAD